MTDIRRVVTGETSGDGARAGRCGQRRRGADPPRFLRQLPQAGREGPRRHRGADQGGHRLGRTGPEREHDASGLELRQEAMDRRGGRDVHEPSASR